MVSDHVPDNATLAEVMHRYALQAPPRQLGAEVGVGLVLVSAALWIRPDAWIVLLAIGCALAMLGVWAWADRAADVAEANETHGRSLTYRLVRTLAAIVGVSAALVTAFAGLAAMLGTWIS